VFSDAGLVSARQPARMTILWFIVWLIANNVGGHEPLLFNPVNAWTATLILAIGLDLGAAHARGKAEEPVAATTLRLDSAASTRSTRRR
jgi:hypothetical protein